MYRHSTGLDPVGRSDIRAASVRGWTGAKAVRGGHNILRSIAAGGLVLVVATACSSAAKSEPHLNTSSLAFNAATCSQWQASTSEAKSASAEMELGKYRQDKQLQPADPSETQTTALTDALESACASAPGSTVLESLFTSAVNGSPDMFLTTTGGSMVAASTSASPTPSPASTASFVDEVATKYPQVLDHVNSQSLSGVPQAVCNAVQQGQSFDDAESSFSLNGSGEDAYRAIEALSIREFCPQYSSAIPAGL